MSVKNMTVGKKLLLGFMSIALLVAVMGYFGVLGTRQISRSFDVAAKSSVPAIRALGEIKGTANQVAAQIAAFQQGTETRDQKNALIGKVETLDRWAGRYERALTAGEGDVRLTFAQNLREAKDSVVLNGFALLVLKERGISGTELGDKGAEELTKAQRHLEEVIAEAINDELAHIRENNVSVSSAAEATLRVNIWVSVLTLAFAASVGLVFARSIGAPIRGLKESVERFGTGQAGGAAQFPVGSGDEIRQLWRSFNHMIERLEKTTVSRDTLETALKEKEVLLGEIHHRVKNNMEIVSSLLELQSADPVDERALQLLRSCQTRIKSMALIHEKLYQSEDLANVDFGEYLRSLVADLYNLYGVRSDHVKLKINVNHILLGIDSAIPSGMIINELVSNSLKHAFPADRHGEISIAFRPDDDSQYRLTVSDNGVGFPDGLDFRNTKSLGLRLVNALTAQLNGTIEVDRSGGTAFKITFEAR